MTDIATSSPAVAAAGNDDARSAGALLRAARQQQGLHIAVLAAAIKVTPAKLEALEAGRLHELPDHTFTRALAKTVCRVLKIAPEPVLLLLPGAPMDRLGRVDGGLNTPFRERPGRVAPADWVPWRHPVLWLAALLLVAAAAFVLVPMAPMLDAPRPAAVEGAAAPVMPPGTTASTDPAAAPADAASAAALVAPAASAAEPLAPALPAATPQAELPAGLVASAPAAGDVLILRALQASWMQAVDGSGQTLMARLVPAGETVELTPVLPVRLRIGNVKGTEISFRGQPVVVTTRDNIANLTLP